MSLSANRISLRQDLRYAYPGASIFKSLILR